MKNPVPENRDGENSSRYHPDYSPRGLHLMRPVTWTKRRTPRAGLVKRLLRSWTEGSQRSPLSVHPVTPLFFVMAFKLCYFTTKP